MRFGDLGAPELLLIVLALVLVFGASKLGEIGGALGKSVREFRKASSEGDAPPATAVSAMPADTPAAPAQPAGLPPETKASIPDYNPAGVGIGSLPR